MVWRWERWKEGGRGGRKVGEGLGRWERGFGGSEGYRKVGEVPV